MTKLAVLGFDEFVAGLPAAPAAPAKPVAMMYAVHYHGKDDDTDATREYYSDRRQALCRMLVLTSCNNIVYVFVDEFRDVDGEFKRRSRRVMDDVKVDDMFDRLSLSDLEAITKAA